MRIQQLHMIAYCNINMSDHTSNNMEQTINVTVRAETRHIRTQTEIYFIAPAYSHTKINSYACSLPPLAKVNWSAFPECFLPTM